MQLLLVIQLVWEALDYPCAERLKPLLLPTAKLLHNHKKLTLTPLIRSQLAQISKSTLARRLATLEVVSLQAFSVVLFREVAVYPSVRITRQLARTELLPQTTAVRSRMRA